jgi:sugar fermentation stimulation protein A
LKFVSPLEFGVLIKRRVRFLADITLETGQEIVAHCPNSGSMKGVYIPGARVAVSRKPPGGKLDFTWEMIFLDGAWVGVNTLIPNRVIRAALEQSALDSFRRYRWIQPEAWISKDTRIDFALGRDKQHWLEVKNVTLVESGVARFPDSVTTRGQKHLLHLTRHAQRGGRSSMLYFVQHHGARSFEPADDIDPTYGKLLRKAVATGVAVHVWKARVTPRGISLAQRLPFRLP